MGDMQYPEDHREDQEIAQSAESRQLSRRDVLKMGGLFAAGAYGLLSGNKAEAASLTMNTVNERRKAVEDMNKDGHRLTLDYDPTQEGKGLLAPGVVKPTGFHVEPVRIAKTFESSRGSTIRTGAFLEIPTNFGYQRNLGTDFYIVADGKKVDAKDFEAEIVYSEPCRENPHRYPMAKFDFGVRADRATVVTDSWVLMPDYDTTSQLQAELLKLANGNRAVAQQQFEQFKQKMASLGYGNRTDQELADAAFIFQKLDQRQFAAVARKIFGGLKTASAMRYNSAINSTDPRFVSGCSEGDCGTKAAKAKLVAGGPLELIEGYRTTPTDAYGGHHAINYALLPDGTSFTADAQSGGNVIITPTNKQLIVCKVGEFINIPDNAKYPRKLNHVYSGANNGAYNSGTYNSSRVAVTTIRGGADPSLAALARTGPDNAIGELASMHKEQISAVA